MSEKIISALIEGGKATAGPPIGPALGPIGINAGKVVADINAKTKDFAGTTVPVKIIVDTVKKTYEIKIGTPPVSGLIKKELGITRGSPKAKEMKAGSLTIDQAIKISRSKKESLLAKTPHAQLKEVIGACIPMGILIDEKDPRDMIKEVNEGKYDNKILGKTELTEPTQKALEEMRKKYELKEEVKEEAPAPAAEAPAEAAAPEGKEAKKKGAGKGDKKAGKEDKKSAKKK